MKILFVCLGNICRSPTAEGVFRKLASDSPLAGSLEIDSAGTVGFHAGHPPDPRSIEHAALRGFDLGNLRARKVIAADFEHFDHVIAMDSLIYYGTADLAAALARLCQRSEQVVFTVAPRTAFLMTFWGLGKLFPRADRSPTMVPHAFQTLNAATDGRLTKIDRVSSGFYISECLEYRP